MICVDTTFLVDLWRERKQETSVARRFLAEHPGEEFAVPAHAAGEFLEGGASVSPQRLADSLVFLRAFSIGATGVETALLDRMRLLVEGGLGFNDRSPAYLSVGLTVRLR